MRVGCIPLLMTAAWLVQAQQSAVVTTPPGNLSIPAELTKTVRADKAHRGDPVEFTTVEAILVAPKLVMPPQSKLFGRVVGAAPRQGDKPSWIVLLVERAEWKQYSVPLHAFITSQITMVQGPSPSASTTDGTDTTNNPRRTARMSGRVAAQADTTLSTLSKPPTDATGQEEFRVKPAPLKDVRIVRDKDGMSYLFSSKSDVKLPGGTLFMLQNHTAVAPDQPAAAQAH
jgi:hypothetical protein